MALTADDLQTITAALKQTVETTVNGKIDKIASRQGSIEEKLDAHIALVQPYMQGISAFRLALKFFAWVGGGLILFDQVFHTGTVSTVLARIRGV